MKTFLLYYDFATDKNRQPTISITRKLLQNDFIFYWYLRLLPVTFG